ncbi:MAG: hypothetical protein RL557_846 [archaeon]|jgi:uncharacterized membrane protein YuzA (DUF378 family)
MAWYDRTALVIAAIGAINWGLASFDWNLVDMLVGSMPMVANVVYWIVGLCGIWALIKAFQ